jgi:hypothetical protein
MLIRRFEVAVLKPLQLLLLGEVILTLLRARWWWLAAGIAGLLYLGTVGSKLHPLQSASDLAQGPIEGRAAVVESLLLPAENQRWLVSSACTRVGILSGIAVFLTLFALDWRWYSAGAVSLIGLVTVGAILKVIFRVAV